MATMMDLTASVKRLVGSFTHGKFAEELGEVQRMMESVQAEQAALHEQNLKLMAENTQLKNALAARERAAQPPAAQSPRQIEDLESPRQNEDLDEISRKILIDISNNETAKESIIAYFQLTKAKGDHYFDVLEKRNFIRVKYTLDDDVYFVATPEGTAYLENR